MQDSVTLQTDAALADALRARGQRVTSQRLVIARLVREGGTHVTAEEIFRRAGEQLPGVSLPTVYATLELLSELGLVRQVRLGGPVLYDARADEHAHLRCPVCGRITDLDVAIDVAPALGAARAAGYAPEGAELIVEARCPSCTPQGSDPEVPETA